MIAKKSVVINATQNLLRSFPIELIHDAASAVDPVSVVDDPVSVVDPSLAPQTLEKLTVSVF